MAWTEIEKDEPLDFGAHYRTSFIGSEATYPLVRDFFPLVQDALKIGSRLSGSSVKITNVEFFTPITDELVERGHKKTDWCIRVSWERAAAGVAAPSQSGVGESALKVAAAIVSVVGAVLLSWVIVAKFTEKEFFAVADTAKQGLSALFNPGVVIAALAAIALLVRHRR